MFVPVDHMDPNIPTSVLCPRDSFNVFEGYAIRRSDAEEYAASVPNWEEGTTAWFEHGKEILCSGEDNAFQYLLNWLAHLLQVPYKKPLTSIRFTADEGAGKGIFMEVIRRILGKSYIQIDNAATQLSGSFNEHLANVTLIFSDEAIFKGDKKERNAMKTKITERKKIIHPKFRAMYEANDYSRIIEVSNDQASTDLKSRRYVDMTTSSDRCAEKDRAYWDRLAATSAHAVAHFLYTRDIQNFDPTDIPATAVSVCVSYLNRHPK
jgi:putative DNA primase/helicase